MVYIKGCWMGKLMKLDDEKVLEIAERADLFIPRGGIEHEDSLHFSEADLRALQAAACSSGS
jgi:hypothetical protein